MEDTSGMEDEEDAGDDILLSGVGKRRLRLMMTTVMPWRGERPCVGRG